ncbi:hypothetical protein JD77_02006 [Micromonospora olivasterospora]|uniref:Lipoprotein n=1 Tax=Micromonospora olivasterospora TaxID=1880 RepID=A0A562I8R8_MICOL|nr:hypothetical protein JD77_02006 [Micromonospora olivasterospora]
MARRLTGVLALTLPALLAACADGPPAGPAPTPSGDPTPAAIDAARNELAALAAAARDRHFTARYALSGVDGPDRSIVVTRADDGTWRVDVPGGALGGTADIALVATGDGLFQCGLPSAGRPEPASCVRLGGRTDAVPRHLDPWVQHPFTDWLEVLTDRRAPLAVSPARPPAGATGACYSVDSTSASLTAPLGVGIYCYAPDGTPTAVRTASGTLTLSGPAGPAPASVRLAGPVTDADPLGRAAPSPDGSTPAGTGTG